MKPAPAQSPVQYILERYCKLCVACCTSACAAAVSSKVYDLLGGVVEHCGNDDIDLPDETKLLQRLSSLNVMRLEGAEPDVQLWTVSDAPP